MALTPDSWRRVRLVAHPWPSPGLWIRGR